MQGLGRVLLLEAPVDLVEKVRAQFAQQHRGPVVDPLRENETSFALLRFAPSQNDGLQLLGSGFVS